MKVSGFRFRVSGKAIPAFPYSRILVLVALCATSGCAGTIDKLARTGEKPPFSSVDNPQTRPGYQALSWPLPDPQPETLRTANSLWQPGSRAFFRDQRAARVGDILRVNVSIADQAKMDNSNNRQRTAAETAAAPSVLGLEVPFRKLTGANPASLLDASGNSQTNSTGTINRKETINTQVAALITQVLPNGNLAIEGSQEILVNYEIRQVGVKGVVRPQDINSDNTVDSSQVAEARITYSGRGQISDIEQPRWGQQVLDAISPF